MREKLFKQIEQGGLFSADDKLLVAVSGGVDSTALLHVLVESRRFSITAVHVNHQLRGKESDFDQNYIEKFCDKWEIPLVVRRVVVTNGGNKQDKARNLRYQSFLEVAQEQNIKKVLLAHHADDQVETILLHLLRGMGTSGLVGMEVVREWSGITIVRPMLEITRKEIELYCQEHSISPCQDSSNLTQRYQRNQVRHDLVPILEKYNPRFKESILQLREIAHEEEQEWFRMVNAVMKSCVTHFSDDHFAINLSLFRQYSVALQRRVIKLLLDYLAGRTPISMEAIEKVRIAVNYDKPSVSLNLAGSIEIVKEYEHIHLYRNIQGDIKQRQKEKVISAKKKTVLSNNLGRIEVIHSTTRLEFPSSADTAIFDEEKLFLPLKIRTRQPGDRIRILGLNGTKKVKKLMMEAKIPRSKRDVLPIIISNDQIIWIPGIARSDVAIIDLNTKSYVYLVWYRD